MTPTHQAARAFYDAAARELRALDRPSTRVAVAAIVGETPQAFGDALHGRSGSLERLATWLERWKAAELPELELVVAAGEVEVRRR